MHDFRVEQTLKGIAPDELIVAQTPMTCPGPGPDPLASGERMVVMLIRVEGVYRPLTPQDGVLPLPEGDELPFTTD